jgi:2-keto-4-pentenoate hydratase/2-oxohepta-3-ene-1,7-dioic acid hydratase in catechol pathway
MRLSIGWWVYKINVTGWVVAYEIKKWPFLPDRVPPNPLQINKQMKLIRFGTIGQEQPGLQLADGRRIDVRDFGEDYNENFFANDGLLRLQHWLSVHQSACPEVPPGSRLGSCIARPSKIICIGLNYAKHAQESGMAIPTEPILFFKSTTALCGPDDPVIIPKGSEKTDWEVELAFVIGKQASYVSLENAWDYVAGYTLHNDYSERAFQLERGGQWVKGKSCDTFAPLGPVMATKDEIGDPHNLRLWLHVNGEKMQDSNTSDLIFDIPTLVSYVSQFMTLLPGDVVSTGTPFGVGLGLKPARYLKVGDVVELGIDGLGSSRQEAVAYSNDREP